MASYTFYAPAKVNLTLKLLGKRKDGFHEIESLMAPLELSDQIRFQKSERFSLSCNQVSIPTGSTNLVTKALRIFEKEIGKPCHWKITLTKKIPHGAGLGGGSSDAATTLMALNDLEHAGFTKEKLKKMSASIGSDIPFFIQGGSCQVQGRGEYVRPMNLEKLKGVFLLLFKPGFSVITSDAYKNCLTAPALNGVQYSPQKTPWGEIFNDLEKPVFYKHRFLAEMKMWLLNQPEIYATMMSGSGSTMMAFLSEKKHAKDLINRVLRELDPTMWIEETAVC